MTIFLDPSTCLPSTLLKLQKKQQRILMVQNMFTSVISSSVYVLQFKGYTVLFSTQSLWFEINCDGLIDVCLWKTLGDMVVQACPRNVLDKFLSNDDGAFKLIDGVTCTYPVCPSSASSWFLIRLLIQIFSW